MMGWWVWLLIALCIILAVIVGAGAIFIAIVARQIWTEMASIFNRHW